MPDNNHTEEKRKNEIWIISDSSYVNLDLSNICKEHDSGPVTEYRISELTQYLLNPNPISLKEKVIGYKVHYHKSGTVKNPLPIKKNKDTSQNDKSPFIEEILSTSKITAPTFEDDGLNAHFSKIIDMLRPYNPAHKKLASLDREKVEDITALCEEVSGNRYTLNLQGSLSEKINFVGNSLSKKTKVVFNKAYLLSGLFEMRGFEISSFNAENYFRLIKFMQNNEPRYCVLNKDYKFKYWIEDKTLVNYMHLFEQSIQTDPRLREALLLCVEGKAKPLKLFFSRQLEQKYSEKRLPETYREMLNTFDISLDEKNIIADTLNSSQSIVFFNYIPKDSDGRNRLFTNISVMHDFEAIEPIKSQLPELYSKISQKMSVSDAGKLYLLDSMREYQNV
jgi:hypothetical protein